MLKLQRLKRYLSRLGADKALWLSAGKDSRLLLEVLLLVRAPFSVLSFQDSWTREQRKTVDELTIRHDLRVYSYPPAVSTLVGDGRGELTLVSNYAVGAKGETASLFRDLVPGSRCIHDVPMKAARSITPPVQFGIHIMGTKRGETHYAMKGREFLQTRRWRAGGVSFVAPLIDWNDAEVVAALATLGIEWTEPAEDVNSGNLPVCMNCLKGAGRVHCPKENAEIDAIEWAPQANLAAWQQAAGV